MFQPLSLYIGLRYTRAKKRNHFISFISLISMLGIALGIAVLITVLSVMNGFDYEIHNHIFNMTNQVTVTDLSGLTTDWNQLANKVKTVKEVTGVAPFVSGQGMLSNDGMVQGIMLSGVSPTRESQVSKIQTKMVQGKLTNLTSGSFGIILGQETADNLHVKIGDKITIITPKATLTPIGILPRFKRFTVAGIFHVGGGFGYDSSLALINLHDAQKLLQMGTAVTGLRVKVDNLYAAPKVANELMQRLPENYSVSNWTQQYGAYFKAITMEKTMMFIILLFIIAVAAFNLVSGLVMTVTDKQADIAILRTLGASPRTIMTIFIIQGAVIGLVGTLIGVIGGIILALNAPAIVAGIEHTFHTQFISASVYFIDYLPSRLDWHYVINVSGAALIMSLLATIYPAWRAAKTQPAEALRYE
ncbi:MAG: lipoprotein-releasing ABC transporter permease subunit [Gammaproteobacteria bacterium]|nr:lipoprotein-releasing ABC transporter permease subunit [Gammaproteobacteria bacterium]